MTTRKRCLTCFGEIHPALVEFALEGREVIRRQLSRAGLPEAQITRAIGLFLTHLPSLTEPLPDIPQEDDLDWFFEEDEEEVPS
jgi:hypothetical protein